MKITLNEEESQHYLDLQENYDNIRGVLLLEAEKAIARNAEIATLTATIQELQATLEAREAAMKIQDTSYTESLSRVTRDSQFAKDLEPVSAPLPPWKQEVLLLSGTEQIPLDTVYNSRWSRLDIDSFKAFVTKTGIYGSEYRTISFLAEHFGRTEASIKTKVYELFNGTRYIRDNKILEKYSGPKGNS